MELLDQYLNNLKSYLPAAQRNDIVQELSANIRSQMDDREAELGRPLTEAEQADILQRHGSLLMVAGRYRLDNRGVAFGWELIGPELFPHYLKILSLVLGITILPFLVGAVAMGSLSTINGILFPLSIQFAVVTLGFALLNIYERRHPRWRVPPAYLRPIPRWQSLTGLAVWTCCILWLLAVPHFPYLIFGPAAANLTLALAALLRGDSRAAAGRLRDSLLVPQHDPCCRRGSDHGPGALSAFRGNFQCCHFTRLIRLPPDQCSYLHRCLLPLYSPTHPWTPCTGAL